MPDEENHTPSQIKKRLFITRSNKGSSIDNWKEMYERPEGLLTDKQRRFLSGIIEYTGDNARQERYGMRQRIRRRYIQGVQDLAFLRFLDEGSCSTIVDELGEFALYQFAAELLEFIYLQTGKQDLLNKAHETAIHNALCNNPELRESSLEPANVRVETEIDYPPDLDEIGEQAVEMGFESLQPEEAGYLIQNLPLEEAAILEMYQNALDKYLDQPSRDLDQLNESEVDTSELLEVDDGDSEE